MNDNQNNYIKYIFIMRLLRNVKWQRMFMNKFGWFFVVLFYWGLNFLIIEPNYTIWTSLKPKVELMRPRIHGIGALKVSSTMASCKSWQSIIAEASSEKLDHY